jgi:branched-chain amino acid transport system ATP-binding protein
MIAGGFLAGIVGILIGLPTFKMRGAYFALATIAFGEGIRVMVENIDTLGPLNIRGPRGLEIPPTHPGFVNFMFNTKEPYYYIILVMLIGVIAFTYFISRSKLGYFLIAGGEEPEAAMSLGVNVARAKLIAMAMSAFLTALAGTFYAQFTLYIYPKSVMSLDLSFEIAFIALIGGRGSIAGPVLGALLLRPVSDFSRIYFGSSLPGLHLTISFLTKFSNKFPRERTNMNILEINNLVKDFGGLRAVDTLSLSIKQGEILGMIGPNGAGKSTAFNCIAGVYAPTKGDIFFTGKKINGVKPWNLCKNGLARTFQIVKPFKSKSVLYNVMVGSFTKTDKASIAEEKALKVLQFLNFEDKKNERAGNLTIADRKRLEIARALATEPKLLLFDEVMAGLRPNEVDEMVKIIKNLRSQGITIFVIEHIMRAIMALSDRIVVIHFGKKIAEGSPQEVASDENVIKAYLGDEYVVS